MEVPRGLGAPAALAGGVHQVQEDAGKEEEEAPAAGQSVGPAQVGLLPRHGEGGVDQQGAQAAVAEGEGDGGPGAEVRESTTMLKLIATFLKMLVNLSQESNQARKRPGGVHIPKGEENVFVDKP